MSGICAVCHCLCDLDGSFRFFISAPCGHFIHRLCWEYLCQRKSLLRSRMNTTSSETSEEYSVSILSNDVYCTTCGSMITNIRPCYFSIPSYFSQSSSPENLQQSLTAKPPLYIPCPHSLSFCSAYNCFSSLRDRVSHLYRKHITRLKETLIVKNRVKYLQRQCAHLCMRQSHSLQELERIRKFFPRKFSLKQRFQSEKIVSDMIHKNAIESMPVDELTHYTRYMVRQNLDLNLQLAKLNTSIKKKLIRLKEYTTDHSFLDSRVSPNSIIEEGSVDFGTHKSLVPLPLPMEESSLKDSSPPLYQSPSCDSIQCHEWCAVCSSSESEGEKPEEKSLITITDELFHNETYQDENGDYVVNISETDSSHSDIICLSPPQKSSDHSTSSDVAYSSPSPLPNIAVSGGTSQSVIQFLPPKIRTHHVKALASIQHHTLIDIHSNSIRRKHQSTLTDYDII